MSNPQDPNQQWRQGWQPGAEPASEETQIAQPKPQVPGPMQGPYGQPGVPGEYGQPFTAPVTGGYGAQDQTVVSQQWPGPNPQGYPGQPGYPVEQPQGGYPPQYQQVPGQQFGYQQYPGQPDPNQPGFGAGAPPKKSRKGLLIGLIGVPAVVVILAIVLVALWAGGVIFSKKFDNAAVNKGVTSVLTGTYNISDVSQVACNTDGVKVKAGSKFTCTATIAGKQQTINVEVKDSNGTYQVDAPAV